MNTVMKRRSYYSSDYSSPRLLWGSWISPSKKERERRRKGEKRGKKKIRKNKREGLVHPSKSSKLKILTMSKVPEVAVERKSSAGHNVSLSRRMLLPMDDLDDNQLSRVHYIDCIMEFTGPIQILAVQSTLALNLFGDLGLGLVFAR